MKQELARFAEAVFPAKMRSGRRSASASTKVVSRTIGVSRSTRHEEFSRAGGATIPGA